MQGMTAQPISNEVVKVAVCVLAVFLSVYRVSVPWNIR